MPRYFQYVDPFGGTSPGMVPDLGFLIHPGVPFEAPELFVQDFEQDPYYVEVDDPDQPVSGADLERLHEHKMNAWAKWDLARKGKAPEDQPPFIYEPPKAPKAEQKRGRQPKPKFAVDEESDGFKEDAE